MMEEGLSYGYRFNSAKVTLIVASAAHDIWWFYNSSHTRDLEALNEFPGFFRYDDQSNLVAMVVSLYSLYDSYDGTLTVKSLLHDLPNEAQKPLWRKYRALSAINKKVSILRHNLFAHRTSEKTYNDVFAEASIRADDFKKLIDGTLEILQGIAAEKNLSEPFLPGFVAPELAELMRRIKGPGWAGDDSQPDH